jgi:hypothetical protein
MVPSAASASQVGPIEQIGDVAQTVSLGPLLSNPGDDGLLLGVLGESVRVGGLDRPTIRASIRPRYPSAFRVVPKHRGGCPLRDLIAFELGQR